MKGAQKELGKKIKVMPDPHIIADSVNKKSSFDRPFQRMAA